eukprot:CAMPEP_0113624102 /NCGR_PEP_ID=MMETSP0017_2-20120614/12418_1 /TAXON_ID=2856 /ORGANISM="Cylindrotheca closterium" /LENGTH=880 /DNA_ID=CAMNT_0000534109 /DNA_START=334 /DNA_END=2976 /DNA_ORIENTATION=+ /assembly_acc=CAM_ASM_000147
MGNGASRRFNEDEVPKKVAKWRAELEHVKELNSMLSEERKIVTRSMEQELYDKQVELFYLGKSATKHIGFRGYLKIINKVSPRTQADFMKPDNYDKKKQPANRSTAMVLRSAILNFSLFALFEAWLLKRMHFVSIQKHQRRLHQKGWKGIVGFYSEEIPLIQEIFEKQEPGLRERVEAGKKENMDLLEEFETKIFQQEEEILKLRKQLEEMHMDNPTAGYGEALVDKKKPKARMSLDQAFPGTTDAHREFNKARSPVQALIRKMEKSKSMRDIDGPPLDDDSPQKGWRTDNTRTWGAEDSEDESLYTEDKDDADEIVVDNDKLVASVKHDYKTPASDEWSDKLKEPKEPEISVYSSNDDAVSAITMPHAAIADSVSTGDSLDDGLVVKPPKDDYSVNSEKRSVSNASVGSGGVGAGDSLTSSQRQAVRDRDAIRLERERLEKAKADRKRRKEMERVERESFYKQERERLQHQEKRLTMKREESTRMRQGRLQDVIVDENAEESDDGKSMEDLLDAGDEYHDADEEGYLDALVEDEEEKPTPVTKKYESDDDELQVRPRSRASSAHSKEFDDLVDDETDDEVVGLNDMDDLDLAEGMKTRNPMFNPQHHPSMDTDALFIDEADKVEKLDRRRMWQKDKADSDRELSVGDDDSIGNELKRLEEFETAINADEEEVAASNISEDLKLLRSSSGRNLAGLEDEDAGARSRSRSRSRANEERSVSEARRMVRATADSDDEYHNLDDSEVRSATRPRGREAEVVPLDESNRSKSLTKKPRRSLMDHFEANEKSDDASVASKSSRASKGSKGSKSGKKKKKKKGEARRKLKGTDASAASSIVDGQEEVVVRKKKKKKKKPKQNEDDQSYYYDDEEDMTVTSALTSGS